MFKPEENQFSRKQGKYVCAPQRIQEGGGVTGGRFGMSLYSQLFFSVPFCFLLLSLK